MDNFFIIIGKLIVFVIVIFIGHFLPNVNPAINQRIQAKTANITLSARSDFISDRSYSNRTDNNKNNLININKINHFDNKHSKLTTNVDHSKKSQWHLVNEYNFEEFVGKNPKYFWYHGDWSIEDEPGNLCTGMLNQEKLLFK